MNYFTLDDAVEIYAAMMRGIGGKSGFNGEQISRLGSVLVSIQNDDYYPEFADKLTHLIFSCVKFHPFLDGNKRSAIILAIFFMELNGVSDVYEEFALKMEDVVVEVAASRMSKDELWQVVSWFLNDNLTFKNYTLKNKRKRILLGVITGIYLMLFNQRLYIRISASNS